MYPANDMLLELFRAHHIRAAVDGEWITFPGRNLRADATIFDLTEKPEFRSTHLDVRLVLPTGRALCESCAGFGESWNAAIREAFENFAVNSFHVLLAAFFQPNEYDEQISREEWVVGGRACQVILGNIGGRGQPPEGEELVGWFQRFEELLRQQQLSPGTHWIRLFYAQRGREPCAMEVLLDNETWDDLQTEMAAFNWPLRDAFYGVRIFLVIRVPGDDTSTPTGAVATLAEMVGPRTEFCQEEILAELVEAGVAEELANRAYQFTQVAWGRFVTAKLGVPFSPEYLCFNARGEIVESGQLVDEPFYAAASRLIDQYKATPGFRHMTLMSASVRTVNEALHHGSQPADLVGGPACVSLEVPTRAGDKKIRQTLNERMKAIAGPNATNRPWWRFW